MNIKARSMERRRDAWPCSNGGHSHVMTNNHTMTALPQQQGISAGLQRYLSDKRWGLLVTSIRALQPHSIVLEKNAGLISRRRRLSPAPAQCQAEQTSHPAKLTRALPGVC